jgi:hypothetical protein
MAVFLPASLQQRLRQRSATRVILVTRQTYARGEKLAGGFYGRK